MISKNSSNNQTHMGNHYHTNDKILTWVKYNIANNSDKLKLTCNNTNRGYSINSLIKKMNKIPENKRNNQMDIPIIKQNINVYSLKDTLLIKQTHL